MLKITLHDQPDQLRLRLEGRLVGPWVQELNQCWRTAISTTANRAVVVDLREVDFVDTDGQALLETMRREGVQLIAATPLIRSVLAKVERICRCARVEEKRPPKSDVVISTDPPSGNPGTL